MTENNSTVDKHCKSRMSINYSPKTSKHIHSKESSLFHTVVIK